MKRNNQTSSNFKTQKLFDTCRLEGRWKRVDDSVPRHYTALEDGVFLQLSILDANYTESYSFKKNSSIVIKDSIAEFYEEDLLR